MYNAIKKILEENGKCLLIEDGKPVGVVLTMADYEALRMNDELRITNNEIKQEKTLFSETDNKPAETEPVVSNPIGEALAQEMDYPEASADLADIESTDDVTLSDLGIDELCVFDGRERRLEPVG